MTETRLPRLSLHISFYRTSYKTNWSESLDCSSWWGRLNNIGASAATWFESPGSLLLMTLLNPSLSAVYSTFRKTQYHPGTHRFLSQILYHQLTRGGTDSYPIHLRIRSRRNKVLEVVPLEDSEVSG
ncbi:hypothetical protein TNCT_4281 [Trichonephila clavata]|uniref:Uncharacterized protein n=1 Tax=Trichonephila clavata TaxID=2740835 RepID=A0A8X6L3Q3_TRICU|nr:hypothetical protein TNCT_4281 [Trichonephila clavata]